MSPPCAQKTHLNRKHRSRPFVKAGPAFSRRLLTVSVYKSLYRLYVSVGLYDNRDTYTTFVREQLSERTDSPK